MIKNPKIFLEHILECIVLIEEYSKGFLEKEFLSSVKLQNLIARRLEIIGEAVKNLPSEFKQKYPKIEWKKIAGCETI